MENTRYSSYKNEWGLQSSTDIWVRSNCVGLFRLPRYQYRIGLNLVPSPFFLKAIFSNCLKSSLLLSRYRIQVVWLFLATIGSLLPPVYNLDATCQRGRGIAEPPDNSSYFGLTLGGMVYRTVVEGKRNTYLEIFVCKDMFIKHWQFFKKILQNWLMLIFYHFYNPNI